MKTSTVSWQIVRYRPWQFTFAFGLWVLFATVPLVTGLLTKAFFDALAGGLPVGLNVWTILGLMIGVEAARGGLFVACIGLFNVFWQTGEALLRRNLLGWLLQGPGSHVLPDSPGEIVNRFRDDVFEVLLWLDTWLDLTGVVVFAVGALVVMVQINPLITLFVFLPMGVIVVVTRVLSARIKRYREGSRDAAGRVSSFIGEAFGAVLAVKVASAEHRVVGHFRQLNETRRRLTVRDRVFTELLGTLNMNMVHLTTGLILLVAAQRGGMTVGDFTLFVSYLGTVTAFPGWLGRMMARYKQVGVSIKRLGEVIPDAPEGELVAHHPVHLRGPLPHVPYAPRRDEHRLERLDVRGLTYIYPETGRGIEDISFSLERGSFTVVTGRIGAGKTTLLRVLLGVLPRQRGEVLWNGRRVTDPATFLAPPRAAYTPQAPRLFSESLRDNILLGLPEDQVDLAGALRLAVFAPDVQGMERGLATLVGPRGVRLSGGQVQRASAARMFVRDPELLVFDDLSSALDVETERQLWEGLDGGRTTKDGRPRTEDGRTTKDGRPRTDDRRPRMEDRGRTEDGYSPSSVLRPPSSVSPPSSVLRPSSSVVTCHLSGGVAPAGGATAGGPHHCAEGRAGGGRGDAGRATGPLRRDAPPVGRRSRGIGNCYKGYSLADTWFSRSAARLPGATLAARARHDPAAPAGHRAPVAQPATASPLH